MVLGILGEVVGTLVLLGVVEGVLAGGVSRAPPLLGLGWSGGALVAGEVEILWLGLLFPLDFGKGVVGKLGTPPFGMGIPPIWLGPGPIWLGPLGPIWLGPLGPIGLCPEGPI